MYSVQYRNPLAFNGSRTTVVRAGSVVSALSMARRSGINTHDILSIIRLGN